MAAQPGSVNPDALPLAALHAVPTSLCAPAEKLPALLRVANALDCTHATRVVELHASLKGRRDVLVEVLSPFEVDLELQAARQRARRDHGPPAPRGR